jgi:hypothetical protein
VGISVTISGANFTGATEVTFNGRVAIYAVISDTAIQATVPAGATPGPLSVTTPGGTATSATPFTMAPTIASFTPTSGPVGISVAISGANFTGATAVTFNGSAVSFAVISDTAIQATVPAGTTTGPLSVTTSAGTTSASNFTVTATLTVSKTSRPLSHDSGTVTSSSGGINCEPTCSATYNLGTVVTLTATPDPPSVFNGWTGCDTVSGTTCTVTITEAKTVVAAFCRRPLCRPANLVDWRVEAFVQENQHILLQPLTAPKPVSYDKRLR